jgi:DNA-binding CsgD family transcriptional regulator
LARFDGRTFEIINIATSTVSNHLRKIYAKLQDNSRAAAVAKLYEN